MAKFFLQFPLNFFNKKSLDVKFSELDLSSDAGVLLVRQAEEKLKICEGMADCFTDNRDQAKVKHPLNLNKTSKSIDGWDALTYGHQQLSLFHGYYGHYIYFPVLINEASSVYPLFEDVYYAAGTWKEPRRVIMKAEWLEKGANPRFVVTNLASEKSGCKFLLVGSLFFDS